MNSKIVTTITTLVDLESFVPEHSVDVYTDDPLPENFVRAVVAGALKSALEAIKDEEQGVVEEFDPDD